MSNASLQSWIEWKQRCAAALCSATARNELHEFAHVRFQKYARTESYRTNDPGGHLLRVTPEEAWHLLEVYFRVHSNREGTRYKDWLFARTKDGKEAPTDTIQSAATVLMREAVREFIRRECPAWCAVSLDGPVTDDPEAGLLRDLLPGEIDPLPEVEQREYEDLAAQHALTLSSGIAKREAIALLAKEMGRSLADPEVLRHAECKKSVLNAAYHQIIAKVSEHVRSAHSGEDPASLRYLAERTLAHLRGLLLATPEKLGTPTYLPMDGSPV